MDYPIGFVVDGAKKFEVVLDMMESGALNVRPLTSHCLKS